MTGAAACELCRCIDGHAPTCLTHLAERPTVYATPAQLTKIVLQLRDFGVVNRGRRLAIVSDLTATRLRSTKELTAAQAGLLITELDHILKSADPLAGLANACARAAGED